MLFYLFRRSKETEKKNSKSIRFADLASVTGPEQHQHKASFFGGVVEGSLIRLILKTGGSIDVKITADCPKKAEDWASTLTTVMDKVTSGSA